MLPLYAHQARLADFMEWRLYDLNQQGAGVIAGMSTGKTRACLEFTKRCLDQSKIRRALVIAPPRVAKLTWPEEITKFDYRFAHANITDSARRIKESRLVFCSCDSLHKVADLIANEYFDLVFVDEVTKFKAFTAKTRMGKLRHLLPFIPKRVTLTGTPTPQSAADLFAQAYILDNGQALGNTLGKFRARYCTKGGFRGREWLLIQDADKKIRQAVQHLYIVLKTEECVDLPKLVINDVLVTLPASVSTIHYQMKKELATTLDAGNVLSPNAGAAFSKCKQIANGFLYDQQDYELRVTHALHNEKVKAVQEILEGIGNEQVVIFYQFNEDKNMLIRSGITNYTDLDSLKPWLQKDRQVLFVQCRSGSHGLNLQTSRCKYVLFFGLDDSAELYDQGIHRVRRTDGADTVFVYRVLAEGSVDQLIAKRLDGRISSQTEFIAALRSWSRK